MSLKGTTQQYLLEKNEDINLGKYEPSQIDEKIKIPIPPHSKLTINRLLDNTVQTFSPERVFEYDPFSTNCQRFVMDILSANKIPLSQQDVDFILQDVKDLIPHWAKKLAHSVSNVYNRLKLVWEGHGEFSACPSCGGRPLSSDASWNKHLQSNIHIKKVLGITYA
jgi:hypothetical protein